MLRKNFPKAISPAPSNCASVQTDQFLLFLPMQQKLGDLLERYLRLEEEHNQAKSKIEYYKFKNNLVENSLHELTFTFTNKLLERNIDRIQEIKELQELIEREGQQLQHQQELQSEVIQRPYSHHQDWIMFEETEKISNARTNAESQASRKNRKITTNQTSQGRSGSLNQVKASIKGETNPLTERNHNKELNGSQNQFLPPSQNQKPCNFTHSHKPKGASLSRECPQVPSKLENKAKTEWNIQTANPAMKKRIPRPNEKENAGVNKQLKREAELNLKTFMNNFSSHLEGKNSPQTQYQTWRTASPGRSTLGGSRKQSLSINN